MLDEALGHVLEFFEQLADGHRLLAANVVDFARFPLFHEHPIGAHIGQSPDAVEVMEQPALTDQAMGRVAKFFWFWTVKKRLKSSRLRPICYASFDSSLWIHCRKF
jgi:hypothetical protein